jgi:uncharacterized protein YndB with AHSA1/START domain
LHKNNATVWLRVVKEEQMEVERELLLPESPDEVWDALTDPDRLAEWFANDVELDLRPGGQGRFGWSSGEEREACVERVDPERELVFRWSDGTDQSVVAFSLFEVPGGTRLRVTETQLAPTACAGEWACAIELRALLRAPVAVA